MECFRITRSVVVFMHVARTSRASGRSSTPRYRSIIAASDYCSPASGRRTKTAPPRSRGALRPRLCNIVHAPIKRAQGMPGAWLTPAVSCAIVRRRDAHEHTGTAGAARHSLRSGFTAYTALSLETNSSCLHRRRIEGLAKPGWISQTSAGLTPATGARTTRLCRPQQRRSSGARCSLTEKPALRKPLARPALPRPPHPAPNVRDDRDTPLLWERDGGICTGDLARTRSGIFFARGLDRF